MHGPHKLARLLPGLFATSMFFLAGCAGTSDDAGDEARQSQDDLAGMSDAPDGSSENDGTDCKATDGEWVGTNNSRVECTEGTGQFSHSRACNKTEDTNETGFSVSVYYGASGTLGRATLQDENGTALAEPIEFSSTGGPFEVRVPAKPSYTMLFELEDWHGRFEALLNCADRY